MSKREKRIHLTFQAERASIPLVQAQRNLVIVWGIALIACITKFV